jgi:Response regulator containing a CheY-like receiver domain and an HTH DNA-binding domain
MTQAFRQIGACIAALGQADFPLRLLELAELTGARQVMVFELSPEAARCLLSRNYARQGLGEALAGQYLDGWHLKDPLRPALQRLGPGQRRVVKVAAEGVTPAYRERFFTAPGLSGKTAVLVAGQSRRLVVNLYEDGAPVDADLAEVIAQLMLRHVEAAGEPAHPPALSGLSERERAVCLGILAGRKNEAIAGEMGLSPETVITYRRRAYHKLGISSRGALFALCRGGTG